MELIRIDLTNFRSFRESRVELQDFTVLVGENECGKSNILRAIELLDRDVSWEGHVRFALDDEGVVDKGSVRFVFSFSEDDYDAIESNISALIFCNNEYVFGALRGKDVTLSEYIRDHIKEGVFTVNIKDGKRWGSSWTLKAAEFVPADHIFSVATGCPQDFLIDGVQVAKYKFFSAESNISSEYLKPVDVKSLYSNLYTVIGRYTSDNLPRVVYWKYAEGQLFPDEILISEFVEDNDICVPLKNIFIAAGVQEDEISSEIERRLGGHRNDLRNYLRYVSSRATEQLRRVWLDSDVSLELTLDGVNILCGIRDKYNSFGVGQRSEGFKRVLSFLLQISAVAPNRIKGEYVVLIDEPDACLHPSAIRSLRDELVRLSSVYKVVAATHSIFMIDRGNIDRHIIVKKENEITTVQRPSNSNFFSEEVLYNALTYSMFSVLKERNFILEGGTTIACLNLL